jgi:hypothetical protein
MAHHSLTTIASTTPANLVSFAHATLFSPVLSTLKVALERRYAPAQLSRAFLKR